MKCKNKNTLKKGDEWWLVDVSDILATIPNPKEEKVSGKRSIFYFEQFSKCLYFHYIFVDFWIFMC